MDWFLARIGRPTASCFDQLLTPTGKPSSSAREYLGVLMAERLTGEPYETWEGTVWMRRGDELQDQARAAYTLRTGIEVRTAGLCYRDESRMVAGSPDGLADPDGGLEIKCPKPGRHIGWLAKGELPPEHAWQVYGNLWITGRRWWDFVSYHPALPLFVVRCAPDPDRFAALESAIDRFLADLAELRARLSDLGYAETIGMTPEQPAA